MNIKKIMTVGIAGMAMCVNAANASIADVTARQRYPWNGEVDISYSVTGIVEKAKQEGLMTTLKVSAIDLTTSTTNIATTLSGDVSLADGTHKIVWDMNAQGLTFKSTNVVFNVACETTPALYCIVDLSAGASATSYPVSYTNEIPDGSWSDEYKTTKLALRRIEPGTCVVTVDKPYYIGVFEMTQKQYELITGKTPSYFSGNDKRPVEWVTYEALRGNNKGSQYPNSTDVDDDSCVGKLRARTGMHFDLPTEAQWEYACRAGTTTVYSYGDEANGDYMWYWANSGKRTHDVGMRNPNEWGLYDMHGNVWEWCLERYSYNSRVLRGGGWTTAEECCTSSHRIGDSKEFVDDNYHGFRFVSILSKNVNVSCSGYSDVVKIDLVVGTRMAAKTEVFNYSTEWADGADADAMAVVAVDGTTLSEQSGSGTVEWTPTRNGTYELTHKVMEVGEQIGETLTATFAVEGLNPEAPVIKPTSGTIFEISSLTVTMTCASEGATIHYTTDGTTPTMESPVYKKKFRIYGKTTIKAIAFYEDGTPSEMAVAEYALGRHENPTITPSDGSVFQHSGQWVSIAWTGSNGVLRVTTDGSEPTKDSPEYAGPFTIDDTTTIRAKVFSDTWFDSEVVTATLTREWAKVDTPVIAAAETFTGSKNKVTISCATDGAAIYYTLDGSEPTTASARYEKPFCVTGSGTVKAMAVKDDYLDSDIATRSMTRSWSIGVTMGKCDHAFATSGDKCFVRVDDETAALGESMKSGAIDDNQTSILSTTVVGPGTLSFKWKTSCEEDPPFHEWDHAEFVLDGVVMNWLDGITDWVSVSQRIEGDGEHAITWRYVKDGEEKEGDDCLWMSEYVWTSDYMETQTTDVPVPYNWLMAKCCDVVDEYDSYESVAKQKALNKRLTVEQCYVAGVDPESATNDFTTTIAIIDGVPSITWNPDLKSEREYKIWGSTNLVNSTDWHCPTNALDRFFKVTVEMK